MVYSVTHPEEEVLNQLSKLQPLNYNRFYWWRRWGAKKQPLHKYHPLLDKIRNVFDKNNNKLISQYSIRFYELIEKIKNFNSKYKIVDSIKTLESLFNVSLE